MKFPLWLVGFLILVSLVFAGFAAYKLYRAEALNPPTPQEAISQAVEAIPPAEKQKGPLVAAPPVSNTPVQTPTSPSARTAERSARHPISDSNPPVSLDSPSTPQERLLKKIGSVGVNAGEITEVALTTS